MRTAMSVFRLALVIAAVGCSDATGPASPLVGEWIWGPETLQPRGHLNSILSFSSNGTFTLRTQLYGIYPGESPGQLSSYTHTSGTYTTDGDRLVLTGQRTAIWDAFYGPNSPERVENVTTSVFDQARYRIVGFHLILDYLIYPADAPEPATRTFSRLGLD
jgi:hypothetical protein